MAYDEIADLILELTIQQYVIFTQSQITAVCDLFTYLTCQDTDTCTAVTVAVEQLIMHALSLSSRRVSAVNYQMKRLFALPILFITTAKFIGRNGR